MKPPHALSKKADSQPAERNLSDILSDTRATFNSEHGRRELALLRQSVRYDEPSFVFPAGSIAANAGAVTDTHLAAFRDGRKSVIREIILRLETPEDSPEPKPPEAIR